MSGSAQKRCFFAFRRPAAASLWQDGEGAECKNKHHRTYERAHKGLHSLSVLRLQVNCRTARPPSPIFLPELNATFRNKNPSCPDTVVPAGSTHGTLHMRRAGELSLNSRMPAAESAPEPGRSRPVVEPLLPAAKPLPFSG